MVRLCIALCLLVAACAPQSRPNTTQTPNARLGDDAPRSALVIGNGAYARLASLDNPENDANAIAAALRGAGYSLHGGGPQNDLTAEGMRRTFAAFGRAAEAAGGVAFIYYAGHGVQIDGTNYLLPVDANIQTQDDLRAQSIDLQQVLTELSEDRINLKVVVLDACRDNPFVTASARTDGRTVAAGANARGLRSVSSGLSQLIAPPGSLVAFSTAPGSVALDGPPGRNSPYAAALAQAMQRPGLRMEDLFIAVRNIVRADTQGQQTPWETSSLTSVASFSGTPGEIGQSGSLFSTANLTSDWDGRYDGLLECSATNRSGGFAEGFWIDVIAGRAEFGNGTEGSDSYWDRMSLEITSDSTATLSGRYHTDTVRDFTFAGTMARPISRLSGERGPRSCTLAMSYISTTDAPLPSRPAGLSDGWEKIALSDIGALTENKTWISSTRSTLLFFEGQGSNRFTVAGFTNNGKFNQATRQHMIDSCGIRMSLEGDPIDCFTIYKNGSRYYMARDDRRLFMNFTVENGNVIDSFVHYSDGSRCLHPSQVETIIRAGPSVTARYG